MAAIKPFKAGLQLRGLSNPYLWWNAKKEEIKRARLSAPSSFAEDVSQLFDATLNNSLPNTHDMKTN